MFDERLKELEEIYKTRKVKTKKDLWLLDFLRLVEDEKLDLKKYALKAKKITESYFGKAVLLYTPVYISDYCVNGCLYCGFSALNKIKRKKLSLSEIEQEFISLKEKNFDTILILTGDDKHNSPLSYIIEAVKLGKKYFSEILIEIYPLEEFEYKKLVKNGVTGVTLYQETFDKRLYSKLHKFGPKKDFYFRLGAIERAIRANVKEVNIGALFGLNKDWIFDAFITLGYADYLQSQYPDCEINISLPRIKESFCKCKIYPLTDKNFIKLIVLSRIFLPRIGINISTRENKYIRDNIIEIGVTRISAESKTYVGGNFNNKENEGQFQISDKRTVKEIIDMLKSKGYRAEFINWTRIN
ncbi:MAG: 2-iminoacetate synthase ThiH [Elusimicrobiota bacterium]